MVWVGACEHLKERRRIETDEQRGGGQRYERDEFPQVQVFEVEPLLVGQLLEHGALVHPQEIGRPKDDADRSEGCRDHGILEDPQQDEELPHEPVEAWQPQTAQNEQAEERRCHRQRLGHPPIVLDLPGMRALVEEAHHLEECSREDAVIDHLQHRALHSLSVEGEEAGGDEPHVADRRVGDQLLHVGLHQ